MSFRPVLETRRAQPHIEGAGVHLHRAFGFQDPTEADPFLLFDDFRGDHPRDYSAGFPWHPHRGIETITYVLAGTVEHGDSLGNRGILGPGSLQLMTAGRGILHQEMPKGDAQGRMHGFQLWGNLPKALKMTDPRYQDIPGVELPERHEDDGSSLRVVIGDYRGVKSPVDGIAADPQYLDVFVAPGKRKEFRVDTRRRAFAYVFEGAGRFADAAAPQGVRLEKEVAGREVNIRDLSGNRTLVRFGDGDTVTVTAGPEGVRFLLVSGAPIEEPVAWAGPIVMNTEAELRQAFAELRNGTFIQPVH
ncbi:pirin family protein [Pseudogemmobacter blasticus]|uniref:Pirin family protein n=1 Tax=Fuscovulum blasticum DSM 2131 TaxID=1188250 RepID=A0A2T4J6V5_FUSBL|nr:pirin family protein [Fuscovulum blasticum]PTE13629.1 hypothetical protein C5F44_12540 [Fuscovulum blasticum DSM 2131]